MVKPKILVIGSSNTDMIIKLDRIPKPGETILGGEFVTAAGGKQYRTETKWLQLVGPDAPFPLSIAAPPPRLTWPATAGRTYDILSSTNLAAGFQPGATLTPSNSAAQWLDTNAAEPLRFYRVRTAN